MAEVPQLTARQIAGKANRAKRGQLTPEGRQRLRDAALANQPWQHATGPRSIEGKRQAAANGRSRQQTELSVREVLRLSGDISAMIRSMTELRGAITGGD